MAISRSIAVYRKPPYWFAASLLVALLQFLWLSPVLSIIVTGAMSGIVVILVHCFVSRIGREAVSILTLLIMLMPGLYVAPELPHWGILMYSSTFFIVVTSFYTILYMKLRK